MGVGTILKRFALNTFAALVLAAVLMPAGAAAGWEPIRKLDLPSLRLFDLGVVDIDGDRRLDVFTVNHKFRGVLLRNHGKLRFADRLPALGLGHAPDFPGFDSLRPPADMSKEGAYAWLTDRTGEPGRVHLSAVGREVEVVIEVRAFAKPARVNRAEVKIRRPSEDTRRFVVTIRPGGSVVLNAGALGELPISFDYERSEGLRTRDIRVGERGAKPESKQFEIQLHDRHGFAFGDVNADGAADVFMVGGGAGGRIERPEFNAMISDELMLSRAGPGRIAYEDSIDGSGVEKSNCRGRDAAWVDYDRDGILDLFFTCENRPPVLQRGLGRGRFEIVPGPPVGGKVFRWAQLSNGDPRLVAATKGGLEIWRTSGGRWKLEQRLREGRLTTQISVADIDNDGKLDLVTVSNRNVRVFRNGRGRFRSLPAGRFGLPDGEIAVVPVDVNNDGWLDLSTARNGLLLWERSERRFDRIGRFKRMSAGYAILNWPDLDNDGRRDLLAAYSNREFSNRSTFAVRKNRTKAGRWLQVDLVGSRGNRDAIGARVVVRPIGSKRGAPRRITQWVGQNEGSRHSQGHYRTYFGLGRAKAARVTVRWPDGRRTVKRQAAANRLIVLRK